MTPESSWSKNETPYSPTPLKTEWTEPPSPEPEEEKILSSLGESSPFPQTLYENRRLKAALLLLFIWTGIISLHFVSWGWGVMWGLTAVIGIHLWRMCFPRVQKTSPPLHRPENPPFVSLLVAAKNEEKVIRRLVENICQLDYPSHRYELWVIDDNSSDETPEILKILSQEYHQLKVFYRSPNATGGKSGALNQVWPLTQGEIIGVFDADAQITPDLLTNLLPLFVPEKVGAVQIQKAIANESFNFLTVGQSAEMALDSFLQAGRIMIGGTGELRGNGQFVRRSALQRCGGWNEETITDDLDLTFRLQLDHWDINFLWFPPVLEEGVLTPLALWHQRNRWAEGGYQRYLDYWPFLLKNGFGTTKSGDALIFFISQYVLPTAILPDFLMALIRHHFPLTTPVSFATMILSFIGMLIGLRHHQSLSSETLPNGLPKKSTIHILWQSIQGTFYMLHWLVVMASVTLRVSFRPKQLKWVKTQHQG